ncbi:MAG: hypothetical protein K8R02_08030 [Anaerohalosphaeraceae bacterium]|nr:hypothetical protein [Anaerohalosphaeraceae bacterium]
MQIPAGQEPLGFAQGRLYGLMALAMTKLMFNGQCIRKDEPPSRLGGKWRYGG